MENYPTIKHNADTKDLIRFAEDIQRMREKDISDFNNLSAIFMKGRKVGKIPTASIDIATTDRVGDFNYTASYLYIVIDNAGTAAWRRISLGVW